MTAPDRIPDIAWMLMDEDGDLVGYQDERDDLEPYIRKGAFPVEEIRRQVGVLSQAPKFLQGSDLSLFRRILSLLESDDE